MGLTRLAWRDFVHDPRRLTFWVLGMTFAVVMILIEVGFLNEPHKCCMIIIGLAWVSNDEV